MLMTLSEKEQQEINRLVGRFEKETGIEALAAVVGKCDAYPEIPWKAYAIGSALGALAAVLYPSPFADWSMSTTIAFNVMAVLGLGAVFAALSALVPPFGRLFLDRARAEAEARQYALAMFVEREVFRTARRCAVLLLVTRYEGLAVVLADRGLCDYAPAEGLQQVAEQMRQTLRSQGLTPAFEVGLDSLRQLVARGGYVATTGDNVLDDGVVSEKGV